MSLPLVTRFGANPRLDLELANKQYVDTSGGLTFAKVVKAVTQTVNDSTVLVDDDELLASLEANKTYCFLLFIYIQSSTV